MNNGNLDEPAPDRIESETTASWAFLVDTHTQSSLCNRDYPPGNFLTVTNHGIDGDISDGISVISDCNSVSGQAVTMKITSQNPRDDDTDESKRNESSNAKDIIDDIIVPWLMKNKKQIFIFAVIFSAAMLSVVAAKLASHVSEISLLEQRNQDLESEHLALKVEVTRLVELHHAQNAEVTRKYVEIENKLEMMLESNRLIAILISILFGIIVIIFTMVVTVIKDMKKENTNKYKYY